MIKIPEVTCLIFLKSMFPFSKILKSDWCHVLTKGLTEEQSLCDWGLTFWILGLSSWTVWISLRLHLHYFIASSLLLVKSF